jgi:ATP-binding cassette subfamily B protein
MPDGLHTVVGARGVRLSGGQAQRAGAARALVRRPALLVVDDLSSALDVETEAELWERLLASGERTALVVTHRPRVLERADRVVVLGR